MTTKILAEKYVDWVDSASFRGWRVQLPRALGFRARYFSVSRHGSRQQALQRACRYRDLVLEQFGCAPEMPGYLTRRRIESSHRPWSVLLCVDRRTGVKYLTATWMQETAEGRKQRKVMRSVRKWGYEEAYRQVQQTVAAALSLAV